MKRFLTLLAVLMAFTASAAAQCPSGATLLALNTPTAVTTGPTVARCYPATHSNEFAVVIDRNQLPSPFDSHLLTISGGTSWPWQVTALDENCDTIVRAGAAAGSPDLGVAFHYAGNLTLVAEATTPQSVTVTWTQTTLTPYTHRPCSYLSAIGDPIERDDQPWRQLRLDGTIGATTALPLASGSFYWNGQRRIYVQ